MKIAVIDGLGGGLGSQIVTSFNNTFGNSVKLIALGTNSAATTKMINKGADRGATGENAIRVTVKKVDIITGPLGIIIPNSMHGELTQVMVEAITSSSAARFLLGIKQPHIELIGIREDTSINDLIDELTEKVELYIKKES